MGSNPVAAIQLILYCESNICEAKALVETKINYRGRKHGPYQWSFFDVTVDFKVPWKCEMKSKTPISWFLAILINDCLLYQEDFLQSGMTSIEVVIQIYSEYFLRKLSENFKKFFLFIVMERIWTFWKLFLISQLLL